MIKRVPWLRRLKKADLEAPLRLPMAVGPVTNGEAWWPDSPRKALIRKLVLEKAEEVSRREGIDRREFLASACGMATTLYMMNVVNGCAGEKNGPSSSNSGGKGGDSDDMGMSAGGSKAGAGKGGSSASGSGKDGGTSSGSSGSSGGSRDGG